MPDIFFQILTKLGSSRQILVGVHNVKFHESPSSESRADKYGQTEDDESIRRFRDYASTPKNRKKQAHIGIHRKYEN